MKLKDARDYYAFASGKTSDLVRQLAFAGIAVIWIFKSDSPGGVIKLPGELLWPLGLIVIGLVADFLQYVAATICWGGVQPLQGAPCRRGRRVQGAPTDQLARPDDVRPEDSPDRSGVLPSAEVHGEQVALASRLLATPPGERRPEVVCPQCGQAASFTLCSELSMPAQASQPLGAPGRHWGQFSH